METIGEKIRRIRKSKGISQNAVSDICGITQPSYANIESNKTQNITIEIGKGIAKALDASFNELFEIEVPGAAFSIDENVLNDLRGEIERLKKQNDIKDSHIEMLYKEIRIFNEYLSFDTINDYFEYILDYEHKLRSTETTEKEKEYFKRQLDSTIIDLKKLIDLYIGQEFINKETIMGIFFDTNSMDFIEEKANSKQDYIKNCTIYVNNFFNVSESEVENYFERRVVTKWDDTKKRDKIWAEFNKDIKRNSRFKKDIIVKSFLDYL